MSKQDTSQFSYRDNICCVIFQGDKFLLVQQIEWSDDWWKFPQGGIEEGESDREVIERELSEEVGMESENYEIFGKSSHVNRYDWDEKSMKLAGFRWRGQLQKFYLIEYIGEKEAIDLNKKELKKYKWVDIEDLLETVDQDHKIFSGYRDSIEKVLDEFGFGRIRIVLGSDSSLKLEYFKKVLNELKIRVKVVTCQVESGVDEQPLTRRETIKGARNRALQSLKKEKTSDVAVGMEGGLMEEGESLYMICVVVVYTRKGDEYLGVSEKIKIPDKVEKEIRQGRQFGRVIREYAKNHEDEKVKELVSREKSFSQAIRQVLGDVLSEGDV